MNLPPFKLERYFAKYEFNTEYLLCSSDCESMPVADLLALEEGAAEKFQQVWLGYTESQGSPTLRAEICKLYETIQPEDILVHTGAEEAIFLFMFASSISINLRESQLKSLRMIFDTYGFFGGTISHSGMARNRASGPWGEYTAKRTSSSFPVLTVEWYTACGMWTSSPAWHSRSSSPTV